MNGLMRVCVSFSEVKRKAFIRVYFWFFVFFFCWYYFTLDDVAYSFIRVIRQLFNIYGIVFHSD